MYRASGITIITVFLMFAVSTVGQAQEQRPDAELQRVLDKVRETYASLAVSHFEHKIVVEETEGAGKPVSIAELTLVTANQAVAGGYPGLSASSLCSGLCRLESITAQGSTVLVKDANATWLYSSARGEYMKGVAMRDVLASVPSALMLGVHLTPLTSFGAEQWTEVRHLGDEAVEIGGERRDCYVVEATLKSSVISLGGTVAGQATADPFLSPSGYVSLLGLLGLPGIRIGGPGGTAAPALYVVPPSGAEPVRIRLWIDKERSLVLRRSIFEHAMKVTEPPQQTAQLGTVEVHLRLVDTFIRANTAGVVSDALFHFQPAAGTREVPNIRAAASPIPASNTNVCTVNPGVTNAGGVQGARELFRAPDVMSYYKEDRDTVTVSVEAPSSWSPSIHVDVNQDGKKGSPDVGYAIGGSDRKICTLNLNSESSSSSCGQFVSKATFQMQNLKGKDVFSWVIPKSEISPDGKSARIQVQTYTGRSFLRFPALFSDACLISFTVGFE